MSLVAKDIQNFRRHLVGLSLTSDTTLTVLQLDMLVSNTGATATVTATLPVATVGMGLTASRQAAHAFRLKPATGGFILGGAVNDYLEMISAGEVVLYCHAAGTWTVVSGSATWRLQNGHSSVSEYLGFYNIKDFGALLNGIANDSPAVNAANDMGLANKRPVFYPAGNIKVDDPVVIKAPMICAGGNTPRTNWVIPESGTRFVNGGITGSTRSISAITVGTTTTITTSAAHGFTSDVVVGLSGIVGTTQLNGVTNEIVVTSTTQFTVRDLDSTGFGAWVSGGTVQSLPGVLTVASGSAGAATARGFYVQGGFAVDGAGYACTGFHATGNLTVNLFSRFRLENIFVTGCVSGYDLNGFTGVLSNCYALLNTAVGLTLRTANSVQVIGGEYVPADLATSWGVKVISAEQLKFIGANIQGQPDWLGNGIDVAEGCNQVSISAYFEHMAGTASVVGYHARIGGINRYGGPPTNLLENCTQGVYFTDSFSNASIASASVYGSLGPRVYLGNVTGVDLGSMAMVTKGLEVSEYANDISGAMVSTAILRGATTAPNNYPQSLMIADASGKVGRPALSYLPNPSAVGSVGAAIRGYQSVNPGSGITVAAETAISRDGKSSIRITRDAAQVGTFSRCSFFPFGQDDLITQKGTAILTGWIYVPTGVDGTPNDAFKQNGNANLRWPRVGFEFDDGALKTSHYALSGGSGASLTGYYNLSGWTRFFCFKPIADFGVITRLGWSVMPIDDQAPVISGAGQSHSVYIADVSLCVSPQSWADVMAGRFSLAHEAGIFIGRNFMVADSAAPTNVNTYWLKGDRVLNTGVVAGGSPGWVCTTSGAGGTAVFKTEATVAA